MKDRGTIVQTKTGNDATGSRCWLYEARGLSVVRRSAVQKLQPGCQPELRSPYGFSEEVFPQRISRGNPNGFSQQLRSLERRRAGSPPGGIALRQLSVVRGRAPFVRPAGGPEARLPS